MKFFKSIRSAKKSIMLFLATALFSLGANAQMSGSYTIDPANAGAATATMFKNWNSFVKSVYNTSTTVNPRTDGGPIVVGNATLTGNVTVTVMSTNTTAETVTLTFAPLTYSGATSYTMTIDGNSQTFNFGTTAYAPFQFTGADYVTIKNLTLVNASTTPGGFWFSNQSDYNTITGCTVNFSALTTATTTVSYLAFSTTSSSATSYGSAATGTTGQPGSYNTISNNTFFTSSINSPGPYYAISLNGNSSNYSTVAQNNSFTGNTIKNFYYYAIYQYYTNGNIINNNDISRANATSGGSSSLYGIYSYYSYSTSRSAEMSGNNIHDLPFPSATTATSNLASGYLIYNSYPYGNTTYRSKINSNSMSNIYTTTSSMYLFYINYPSYTDIQNNSVNTWASSATASMQYGFYVYYPSYTTFNANVFKNITVNYYIYSFYIYYGSYIDVLQNTIDNVVNNYTSGYIYNYYIYYPTGVRCNGNTAKNCVSNYYFYNFYLYYGSVGTYAWNEFQDNVITNNSSVNYNYSVYIYYYNGTNNFKINRNYCVGNKATATTGYHYFYCYYLSAYQVTNNVVAGNISNSVYMYIYSGNSGFNAEIRNNTFQGNTTTAPTPGSSYMYMYLYLYYHTVQFTGNIIDLKGSGTQYYRYLYMYMSYSNPAGLTEFDYNTYSLNNLFSYPYWYFNGTNYTDWAGFSGSGVQGPHDNGIDPLFVNAASNDWRPGAWGTQNNVPYKLINNNDVAGVQRNKVNHDRGGLENNTDLQAVSTNFTVPATVCAGWSTTTPTYVILKSNYQYDKAKGFAVSYTLNGGPKTQVIVNKAMAYGDTAKIWFPQIMLSVAGATRIAFFIDMPDDNTSNDSFIFNTVVKPAPGGGFFTNASDPTRALYQPSKFNDVTVINAPVYYTINQPRIYTNANYKGNGGLNQWSATVMATTKFGKPVSGMSLTAPTASSDLKVKFVTSDATLEDSMLTLYVIVHDEGNGCDTFIKRPLLIYPTIVPNFKKPTSACVGSNVFFDNNSTVRSGNMEFAWDFGTGVASDNTDQPSPTFAFNKEGTFKVKMTAKTLPYGFVSTDSCIFTVYPIPAVKFSKQNACEGYNLKFTNLTTPLTASTYVWDFGDNTSKDTSKNPVHKYNAQGTYTVKLTANLNGCVSTITQRAYQFEKPVAAFSKLTGDCDNKEFTFSNTSSAKTANIGYFWNFDDGSFSTAQSPKHIFDGFGTKNVKLIVTSEFGCKDSVTRVISVKESPKVSFTHGPACSLEPTAFVNTTKAVTGTYANYNWTFSDGSSSLDENPTHSWGNLGSKTATLAISLDNGCSSSTTQSFDVLVQPKAKFSASDVCSGSPVVFSNSTTWAQGDISYKWDFSDNTNSTESDPIHAYNTSITTTYNVTLVASIAGGCNDTFTEKVTVNEGPKTCDFVFGPDYSFGYYGMNFKPIDGSGNIGGQSNVTYTWVIQNGGQKSGASVMHNFTKDGSYTVTMNALIKSTGCECTKTKTVLMNRAGVQNFETTGVNVYPNPASNNVNIMLKESFGKNVKIKISTITGAILKTQSAENNGLISLNIGDVAPGVYMVTVSNGTNQVTQKLSVEK